ncbi:MAG: radical SAM protein [Myxococcales bacterium]|nr:radical SAM protein [Myxococcales bacterium]
MRVALLYPPPWKIPPQGEAPDPVDGPPEGYRSGDLDADFYQTPYGLFALGAGALRAGHAVKVLNLSSFPWPKVEEVVERLDADVYGLSCWTANRRGVGLVAAALRARRPGVPIVVGGPHATPLAREMLEHHPAIDVVCRGESDLTFLELCQELAAGKSVADLGGLQGALVRTPRGLVEGPPRAAVPDLDALACPHDYFDTHIAMTSRGCPWACTFCGAETSWGRGFRALSVERVVDMLERAVGRLPVKMVQIKDDTFTTDKKRVVAICERIRARGLSFFWSCDTRVDLLTEPLLRAMRLAGCERLSLGVETGSQRILDAIDKKITVAEIVRSTELAKAVGIKVRYYMMLGNRGETAETFAETLAFLERARPHEYIFSCLSVYPGTRDFHDAEAAGWLDREVYFRERFQELKTPFDASDEDAALLGRWFEGHSGLQTLTREGSAEYRAILARLGDHHAAHLDLGGAYYREGDLDQAETHVRRALELGYPLPGLAWNYLGCIAAARRDYDAMMRSFSEAARLDPQHFVLIRNVNRAREWFKQGGPTHGLPLELEARHDFQLLERTQQPTLPGPLPADFDVWQPAAPAPAVAAEVFVKTPEQEGSQKLFDLRGKPVVGGRRP